ncbi:MAG: hypothetical protein EBV64_11795 [Oxalobacteraceae bacterium]|nr:hypothetical protein [Oxalobacteraceae bacterium]
MCAVNPPPAAHRFAAGDPRTAEMNRRSAELRGATRQLKEQICQGYVPLPKVINDERLAKLPIHYVCRLAITTRAADLDKRRRPAQRRSHRIVQLLRPFDLIGHEPVGRIPEDVRRRVALKINAHPCSAYQIRRERTKR